MSILAQLYQCPNCKAKSIGSLWTYCEPYCEDCGNHSGVECPKCQHWIDYVWCNDKAFESLISKLIR